MTMVLVMMMPRLPHGSNPTWLDHDNDGDDRSDDDEEDIDDDDIVDDDDAQIATWLKSYLTPLITTFTAPAHPPLPNWDKRTSIAKQTKLV